VEKTIDVYKYGNLDTTIIEENNDILDSVVHDVNRALKDQPKISHNWSIRVDVPVAWRNALITVYVSPLGNSKEDPVPIAEIRRMRGWIKRALGVARGTPWKRDFSSLTGTWTTSIVVDDYFVTEGGRHLALHIQVPTNSSKCKVTRVTETQQVIRYVSDCKPEDLP
jgi:hypothetical protein